MKPNICAVLGFVTSTRVAILTTSSVSVFNLWVVSWGEGVKPLGRGLPPHPLTHNFLIDTLLKHCQRIPVEQVGSGFL
jgi:hypothetical protein